VLEGEGGGSKEEIESGRKKTDIEGRE